MARFLVHMRQKLFLNSACVKVRLYASAAPAKKAEGTAPMYRNRDADHKTCRKIIVQSLQDLLCISKIDALGIVLKNPSFQYASKALLDTNYNLFRQSRISEETLQKYPQLLMQVDAEAKLRQLQKLPYDVDETANLLLLSNEVFVRFIKSEQLTDTGKIKTLMDNLQISARKACECLTRKSFMLSLSTRRIESNIKTLIEFGIKPEDICKDLWVLRYTENLVKSRLELAKQSKIAVIKTWMIRVPQERFQIHIQRQFDDKSILGDSSLAEYLSKRLDCTINLANYLILKQPALKNRSLKKLKELIDFLYEKGFQSHQICRVPKILVHSVETTRKRMEQLEEKGIKIDGVSLLTKSQNQFMEHYEMLVKSKNKTKKT